MRKQNESIKGGGRTVHTRNFVGFTPAGAGPRDGKSKPPELHAYERSDGGWCAALPDQKVSVRPTLNVSFNIAGSEENGQVIFVFRSS